MTSPEQAPAPFPPAGKDKTVAVLLAVFLGPFTWLYTYRQDAWKFWLGLALDVLVALPLWLVGLGWLVSLPVGIWAIVDAAVKPDELYRQYPRRPGR